MWFYTAHDMYWVYVIFNYKDIEYKSVCDKLWDQNVGVTHKWKIQKLEFSLKPHMSSSSYQETWSGKFDLKKTAGDNDFRVMSRMLTTHKSNN